jgi:hypothetical protein
MNLPEITTVTLTPAKRTSALHETIAALEVGKGWKGLNASQKQAVMSAAAKGTIKDSEGNVVILASTTTAKDAEGNPITFNVARVLEKSGKGRKAKTAPTAGTPAPVVESVKVDSIA